MRAGESWWAWSLWTGSLLLDVCRVVSYLLRYTGFRRSGASRGLWSFCCDRQTGRENYCCERLNWSAKLWFCCKSATTLIALCDQQFMLFRKNYCFELVCVFCSLQISSFYKFGLQECFAVGILNLKVLYFHLGGNYLKNFLVHLKPRT